MELCRLPLHKTVLLNYNTAVCSEGEALDPLQNKYQATRIFQTIWRYVHLWKFMQAVKWRSYSSSLKYPSFANDISFLSCITSQNIWSTAQEKKQTYYWNKSCSLFLCEGHFHPHLKRNLFSSCSLPNPEFQKSHQRQRHSQKHCYQFTLSKDRTKCPGSRHTTYF